MKEDITTTAYLIAALRNYGYRYADKKDGAQVFGKPLGYGILRANLYPGEPIVEVMLLVKGNKKDGERPTLLWAKKRGVIALPNEDAYLAYIQAIADCEAEIFAATPVAFEDNRGVRYDFEENPNVEFDD